MAPTSFSAPSLFKRFTCDNFDDNFDNGDCSSGWNDWGRWVALAVIVVFVLLVAFLFSCFNNRRRRRMGAPPMYGTGWMPYAKPPPAYGYGAPAPPYSQQPVPQQETGNTFNSHDGYYGGHNNYDQGIELQQPQNAYAPQRGGDDVYAAPMGPPPGKSGKGDDGIIR